ncbi:expressed unknown protein [Seminavis robusta]|uniref:Uncharacterized protein n=1 Tax=Seminavis robusta TaxID=568900 RepID=A0A9N8EXN0_9STRA|nr:expressed unknown protein [Seminavis robusta]|eukprot:Sro2367_g325090.1 n/a (401) ;mRNA; f:12230-13432
MAPRHAEIMGRHSIQDDLEDYSLEDEAFDPFDTTDRNDDVAFPNLEAEQKQLHQQHSRKTKPSRSRKPSSVAGRSSRSNLESSRLRDSSSQDSGHLLEDSASQMDEISMSKGSDESRRRARMSQQRTPKPGSAPLFPKNSARRSNAAVGKQSSEQKADGGSRQSKRAISRSYTCGERTIKSKNRSSVSSENSDCPLSPGRCGSGKSARDIRSPRRQLSPRSPLRTSVANSDARLRIRKAAALQREREEREQEEAKLAAQKAKLARQKQKAKNDMRLGQQLAKLDSMDAGGEENTGDGRSVSSKESRNSNDLSSVNSGKTRGSTVEQRRRHRRTHLSHNMLVRNMNQMAASSKDLESSEMGDETEVTLEDISEDTEEMPTLSAEELSGAWQRRRERQQQRS